MDEILKCGQIETKRKYEATFLLCFFFIHLLVLAFMALNKLGERPVWCGTVLSSIALIIMP